MLYFCFVFQNFIIIQFSRGVMYFSSGVVFSKELFRTCIFLGCCFFFNIYIYIFFSWGDVFGVVF